MIRFNCPHCNRFYELHPALARLPLVCKQCGQPFTPPEAEPEPSPPPKPVPPAPKPALPVAEVVAPAPPKPAAKAPAVPVIAPAPPKPAKPAPPPPKAPPPADDGDDDDGVLVTGPAPGPDIDFNVGGPTAASLSDANRPRPAGLSDANRPRPADLPSPGDDINLDLLPPVPPPPPARKRPAKPPEPEPEAAPEKRAEPTLVPFLADLVAFAVLVVVGMFLGELLARKPTGTILSEAGSAPKFPPMDLLLWAAPPATFALIYLLLNSRQRTLGAWLRRRAARATM